MSQSTSPTLTSTGTAFQPSTRPPGQITAPRAVLDKLPSEIIPLLQNIFVELRRLNDYNDETRTLGRIFSYEFTASGGGSLQTTNSSGFALQGIVPSLTVAAKRQITLDFVGAAYLNYPNPTSTQWPSLAFPYRPFFSLSVVNSGPANIRVGTSLDPNYRATEVLLASGSTVKIGPFATPAVRILNLLNVDAGTQDAAIQVVGVI